MLTKLKLLFSSVAVATLLASVSPAWATYFDCSVVYDEFDQLMMGQFLVDPERYVSTLSSLISRPEHLEFQTREFKLRSERENAGIAVFRTNRDASGKMIFYWQERVWDERIPLVLDEIITFGRVEDGYAPVLSGPTYVTAGFAVDLDKAEVVELDNPDADITYVFEDGNYVIEAINPAQVYFPIQSLCHKVQ